MSNQSLVEPEAVHGLALVEPGDEPARLVGRVPGLEVRADEGDVVAVEEVRRGRRKRRCRVGPASRRTSRCGRRRPASTTPYSLASSRDLRRRGPRRALATPFAAPEGHEVDEASSRRGCRRRSRAGRRRAERRSITNACRRSRRGGRRSSSRAVVVDRHLARPPAQSSNTRPSARVRDDVHLVDLVDLRRSGRGSSRSSAGRRPAAAASRACPSAAGGASRSQRRGRRLHARPPPAGDRSYGAGERRARSRSP